MFCSYFKPKSSCLCFLLSWSSTGTYPGPRQDTLQWVRAGLRMRWLGKSRPACVPNYADVNGCFQTFIEVVVVKGNKKANQAQIPSPWVGCITKTSPFPRGLFLLPIHLLPNNVKQNYAGLLYWLRQRKKGTMCSGLAACARAVLHEENILSQQSGMLHDLVVTGNEVK